MIDDALYREEILDHYHSSAHRGRLVSPDRQVDMDNPLCGDRIHLEVALTDDKQAIDQIRFDGHGCAISQAAASILAENVEGKTTEEARAITAEGMVELLGIPLTPARLKCGLLAWKALNRALAE
ncbi:MAG: SUF system NifU family Fe-S cluster assembly protein [Isosphaeraceae bacterium]